MARHNTGPVDSVAAPGFLQTGACTVQHGVTAKNWMGVAASLAKKLERPGRPPDQKRGVVVKKLGVVVKKPGVVIIKLGVTCKKSGADLARMAPESASRPVFLRTPYCTPRRVDEESYHEKGEMMS